MAPTAAELAAHRARMDARRKAGVEAIACWCADKGVDPTTATIADLFPEADQ